MTTPALRALKAGDRHITLLSSPPGAVVAPLVPEIDDVLVYDAPWMKATAARQTSRPDLEMVERLRSYGFDAAVIFTVYSQNPLPTALLCYLADIPLRLAHCRENPYQLLTDWAPDPEPATLIRHEVRRQLDLVAGIGCHAADERLSLRVPGQARAQVGSLLDRLGIDRARRWAVLHPGATAAARRYPAESFAAAARMLIREEGVQLLLTGSEAERELVESIRAQIEEPTHALAGRLDLPQLAALIEQAPLLISNNTGPVHIAAAVGTPVVDLYALTNPQHTPWQVAHRVLFQDVPCKYCYKSTCPEGHHRCLRLVPPSAVVRAACELLDAAAAPAERAQLPEVLP